MTDEINDLKIFLMSGTANTFAITNFMSKEKANSLHKHFQLNSINQLAKKICKIAKVDGFIIITEADNKKNDYKWIFHNSDGSPAEMCGNAARCIGHLTFKSHIADQKHSFESIAGEISVIVDNEDKVTVGMPAIKDISSKQTFKFKNIIYEFNYLDTGVPHCVIKIDNFSNLQSYKELATHLRMACPERPRGSNISFYSSSSDTVIECASFERGVEDFTQACGTGAVAAAYCFSQEVNKHIIEVNMPGGRVFVDFSGVNPYLIGPVKYDSTLFIEDIKALWMNSFTD